MPTAADPASFVDRTADVLHECAGGTRDFARSMATEILERVENDRGFFATHLAENLPRPGAALDVWKRELVKAWVDRRDAAAQERSLRAQATRDDRAAREATAKREFDAAFAAWVAEGNPESVTAYRKHRASLLVADDTRAASCGPERRAPQTARRPLTPANTPPP